jgi:hypothetical protein
VQIIVDEMSVKGTFQAFLLCTIVDKAHPNSYKFQLNKNVKVSNLKNNPLACSWYDVAQSPSKSLDFNCGAIQFAEQSHLSEFKCAIAECQSKFINNFKDVAAVTGWEAPDSLSSSSSNNLTLEFERQITFNLNGIINYSCVSLNLYLNDATPDFFIISIELDKNIFFKHYISRTQKFDTNSSPAKKKSICL